MKKVILFGTGKYGKLFVEKNKDLLHKNWFFCDNDIKKQGEIISNLKVLSFNEVKTLYDKGELGRILITLSKVDEAMQQCIQNGIQLQYLYYYDITNNGIKSVTEVHSCSTHSQDGEELFLREYFGNKKNGFYVDVGAYHPFRFSNTQWAYERGWRGINIEPNIDGYKKFIWARPCDVNLNCGISETGGELSYYEFEEGALNTFCKNPTDTESVKRIQLISTRRLDAVFEEYHTEQIDFLDIDVEGYELSALNSNNWEVYRPTIVLIEQKMNMEDVINSTIHTYMKQKGYQAVSKYNRTVIYQDMMACGLIQQYERKDSK